MHAWPEVSDHRYPSYVVKVAFVDRDGTIIRDYPDREWSAINAPEFLSGSIEGLKQLAHGGYKIIIVTNQYLIDEGFIREQQYHLITRKMSAVFSRENIDILALFYCPHARESACRSCKPNPGMIERALEKYPDIKLKESFVVGDSECDAQLAAHFDMRFYGINIESRHPKAIKVASLLDASRRQA